VINRFGRPCPEKYGEKAVQGVAEALHSCGHRVAVCEGDTTLFETMQMFLPPGVQGEPTGMVFNMAYGIQGECRYTHVPAMLEMAGVPYTGSSPMGHALALDKVITKKLMIAAGVPTPRYATMRTGDETCDDLRFPLVVKPKHESTSFGLQLVEDRHRLKLAVQNVVSQYQQEALVEEYIEGREVCAALLGNSEMEFLPLVEQDFGSRNQKIVTWEDKHHKVDDEPQKICPASLRPELADRIREIALATFHACHCRDYARVDVRIDQAGNPHVLEINSMASLGETGSYVLAGRTAGYSFAALIDKIVDVARARYAGCHQGFRTPWNGQTRSVPTAVL
jgi:D-alanine-D-alanine ligase